MCKATTWKRKIEKYVKKDILKLSPPITVKLLILQEILGFPVIETYPTTTGEVTYATHAVCTGYGGRLFVSYIYIYYIYIYILYTTSKYAIVSLTSCSHAHAQAHP